MQASVKSFWTARGCAAAIVLLAFTVLLAWPETVRAQANREATGLPTISGTLQVGEPLTADTSGISDPDGPATLTFSYQWLADDMAISGATDSTYTLTAPERGKAIKVRVQFTDGGGTEETLTSMPTDKVWAEGDIRLQGGANSLEGRLEIYHEGQWGTVCNDEFTEGEAVVACRELGYSYSTVIGVVPYTGTEARPVWLGQVICNYPENTSRFADCYHDGFSVHNCKHHEDIGIRCSNTTRLAIADAKGPESKGTLGFVVSLSAASSKVVTVAYATEDATALAGSDYTAVEGTLTFAAGSRASQTIAATLIDDTVDESETETFTVVLSNATNATLGDASAVGTIMDDDERGVLVSKTALTVTEGDTAVTYTVVLESEPTAVVTVEVTGHAGTDLTVSPTSLTFTAMDWSVAQTVAVSAAEDDDTLADPEVVLSHAVSGGDYADETADGVTVTVLENDEPTLAIVDAQGLEDVGTLSFEVSLSTASSKTVTVAYATEDAAAFAGSDYTAVAGTLTFAAGSTASQTIAVTLIDDTVDESETETFTVTLSDAAHATLDGARATATGTIADNDTRGVVVAPERLRVTEGNSEDYTVVLRSEPTAAVTVQVTTELAGTDLTVNPTSLTFTADNWSVAQTVKVSAAEDDDALDEAEVVLSHAVSGGDYGAETTDPVTVTVLENDTAVLAIAGDEKSESRGTLDFVVSLRPASSKVVTVAYATADGTALAGSDYTAAEGTLTFAAGAAASQTIAVTLIDDTVDESETETFTVVLSNAAHAELGDASAVGTILDNDDPAVTVSFGALNDTATEGGGAALVTLSLSADPEREVSVPLTVTAGGGASADDYTVSETTLTFASGETTKQVTVTALDDRLDDDGESVELGFGELPERVTAGEVRTVAVTLADNDERGVLVSKTALTVTEGDTAVTYTVVLESEPTAAVTVEVTGHAGTDLTVRPTSLTFTAMDWAVAQTVEVSAAEDDDALADPEVVLSHAVSGGDYADETADDVTVTVLENDASTLAIADAQGLEDVGTLSFEVSLSTASSEAVTVAYATEDATALAGSDYTAAAGTLTFAAGSAASQTIAVTLIDDTVDESETETFTVVLSNAAHAELGDASAVGTILDNDDPAVTVSFGALGDTATEGGGAALVTLSLSADPEREVVVPLTVTAGGGASADDYTVSETTLTFASGETTKQVTVTALDDRLDDDGESVELGFGELPERVTAGEVRTVAVTLADNDERGVVVSPERLTVSEGGSASYTVVLESEPTAAVTVEVTGHAGTDLTVSPTSLTFTASDWSVAQTVAVSAAEDDDTLADPEVVLSHAVSGGDYADETADGVTVTVLENDAPTLAIADAQDLEDVGTLRFVVSLSTASSKTVTVAYATEDGTALAGSDYTAVEGTLTFAAGSTAPQPIAVSITDDRADEPESEMFTVVLSDATNATLGDASAVGTILDNDVAVVQNASPVLVGALDEQALQVGGESVEVGVSEAFRDADGDALRYTAASSDRSVAVAVVSGATVTVTPVGVGLATVTVRATDTAGASVVQTFGVTVTLALMESHLRLEPQADGGTLVAYEPPSGASVRIEVPAARVGVRVLDTDGDGDVDGADELPMVRPVLASEFPSVPSDLRVTVDRSSAVDITLSAQTVSGGSRVRVCLATTLEGESLSLYRYDAASGEWSPLASEVEVHAGVRFVCAWVDGFSVFAVFGESSLSVGSGADVNGDGKLDGDDALVMYYAYELGELLGDGDSGGVARFRRTLLAGPSGKVAPSDGALMEMLRRSQAWRASGVDAGGDVNGDGELDGDDALLMYYAYELGGLLGDGDSGGVARFRQTLLAGPSGQIAPSDADLMAILRNANKLREMAR